MIYAEVARNFFRAGAEAGVAIDLSLPEHTIDRAIFDVQHLPFCWDNDALAAGVIAPCS
ncbi:hypothetical protein [Sphingomonas hankookensis]|uniref:hypothetical protein n=1 Tax=Sphingomonas hankookensis TaxID=563996 RepID=UPI000B29B739|nr:hypothetical protein [Sphingomonas hankookensis]